VGGKFSPQRNGENRLGMNRMKRIIEIFFRGKEEGWKGGTGE
jgi:hypothetical protein